ncbi:MAG: thioredoxin family protein [Chloroflexota bacterium]
MIERTVIALILIALVLVVSLAVRAHTRRRTAKAVGTSLPVALTQRLPGRGPAIVYFYGPHCADCRHQAAVLQRLAADRGIAVARVDATRESSLADTLAVMTVPSTMVVDATRHVRAVNLGFRPYDDLFAQLRDLGEATAEVA